MHLTSCTWKLCLLCNRCINDSWANDKLIHKCTGLCWLGLNNVRVSVIDCSVEIMLYRVRQKFYPLRFSDHVYYPFRLTLTCKILFNYLQLWQSYAVLSATTHRIFTFHSLSLIHIWRCRRIERCRSRWSPYH